MSVNEKCEAPNKMNENSREEAMSTKKSNTIIDILGKIVVPLVVAIIASGTTYVIATREETPPPQTDVAVESMPVHIFAFAGNNNPDGGWSVLDIFYEDDSKPIYKFTYSLPTDGTSGYAGLAFKFEQEADLSEFESISFLLRIPPDEEVDLLIKDISGQELRYRLRGGPQDETEMDIAFSNFNDINLKAVREVMFFVDSGLITGDHSFFVKDIKFLR